MAMHDARKPAITLRSLPRGDVDWVVPRHGALHVLHALHALHARRYGRGRAWVEEIRKSAP